MATMSKAEREGFLSKPHVGILGVDHPGRGPLTVPIWYDYEPGGDVVVLTGPTSLKATLIAEAGRFSLCVQQESLPYRYVMVEGTVNDTRDADLETDELPMAVRYLGKKMGTRYCEDSTAKSIRISMTPDHWFSGDYGKTEDD